MFNTTWTIYLTWLWLRVSLLVHFLTTTGIPSIIQNIKHNARHRSIQAGCWPHINWYCFNRSQALYGSGVQNYRGQGF